MAMLNNQMVIDFPYWGGFLEVAQLTHLAILPDSCKGRMRSRQLPDLVQLALDVGRKIRATLELWIYDGRNPAPPKGCLKPHKSWDVYHLLWIFTFRSIVELGILSITIMGYIYIPGCPLRYSFYSFDVWLMYRDHKLKIGWQRI